ncbi:hypothetical protein OZ411_25425 [Bradyrhizobium sp. Arg237L]|uniref:hypothetical protein n=1 Tax=Bradyrhizobium sp. Arg237L TaxID=3003352 RepID=UPI00249DFB54|nr:hypothetical protein [Bradyrhizobium sp. Arg237L]MDI4236157.1 hypothetical protein [Bradyrhizobium sp. Arg237L]
MTMTAHCPKLDVETANEVSPSQCSSVTTKRPAADWLSLAAAPTFAVMALLTGVVGGAPDMLCSQGTSPFAGMVPMYVLMSAFHLGPWLRLIARR